MIEEMYPHLPAIELFARAPRLGWDVWGNEVEMAE
jgi:N6-adenosine-specific RNA methylase IME4